VIVKGLSYYLENNIRRLETCLPAFLTYRPSQFFLAMMSESGPMASDLNSCTVPYVILTPLWCRYTTERSIKTIGFDCHAISDAALAARLSHFPSHEHRAQHPNYPIRAPLNADDTVAIAKIPAPRDADTIIVIRTEFILSARQPPISRLVLMQVLQTMR
jgi:hypothetical protein